MGSSLGLKYLNIYIYVVCLYMFIPYTYMDPLGRGLQDSARAIIILSGAVGPNNHLGFRVDHGA